MKKLTCTRIWWFQPIKENMTNVHTRRAVRHSQHAVTQTSGIKETNLALESKEKKGVTTGMAPPSFTRLFINHYNPH